MQLGLQCITPVTATILLYLTSCLGLPSVSLAQTPHNHTHIFKKGECSWLQTGYTQWQRAPPLPFQSLLKENSNFKPSCVLSAL